LTLLLQQAPGNASEDINFKVVNITSDVLQFVGSIYEPEVPNGFITTVAHVVTAVPQKVIVNPYGTLIVRLISAIAYVY